MISKEKLEEELMNSLKELTNNEQEQIKIFYVIYLKSKERIKSKKIQSMEKSILGQIEFYGRNEKEFSKDIGYICNKYADLIDKIINQYDIRFCMILEKLQELYDNQKIAITNKKTSIDSVNELNYIASCSKVYNYEIVINESKKQMIDCKKSMVNELNNLFYNRDKELVEKKANIFQKIFNIFSGKSKVNNFVINPVKFEINELEKSIDNECEKIKEETINQLAVIEDAIMQTKEIFNNIVKENVNYE